MVGLVLLSIGGKGGEGGGGDKMYKIFRVSHYNFRLGALQFAENLHLPGGFKLVRHLAISSYLEILLSFEPVYFNINLCPK